MRRRRGIGVTKKHLARAERERIQKRWILGLALATVLGVAGLLGYGYYDTRVLQPLKPVAEVNGVKISAKAFVARVRLEQIDLIGRYQQLEQFIGIFGGVEQAPASIQQEYSQVQLLLSNNQFLGQQVLDDLIAEVFIQAEAASRGITVTQEELQVAIGRAFAYYPGGTPTPLPTATLDATIQAGLVPTFTPTEGPSATPSLTPTARPTATPYTQEMFEANYSSYLTAIEELGITEEDYLSRLRSSLLNEKVMASFGEQVEKVVEQTKLSNIIFQSKDLAEQGLQSLRDGAQDWETLTEATRQAAEGGYTGGDLGWLAEEDLRLRYGLAFQAAASLTAVGEYGGPVEANDTWQILWVEAREVRALDPEPFARAQFAAFNAWLDAQRDASPVTIDERWQDLVPPLPLQGTGG